MSLRARFIVYLVAVHALFAGLAWWALDEQRYWLLAVEAVFVLSLWLGLRLSRRFWMPLELINTGAELIEERDFTSKFLEVGQPEMDQLVRVYNRMIEQLREERTRLQEQHFLMDKILAASPSGIITLDFDGRIDIINPGTERIAQLTAADLVGQRLDEVDSPFVRQLAAVPMGSSPVLPGPDKRQIKCHKGQFLDQGFQRSFVLLEELTQELRRSERTAYEKVIRLLAHEVNNSAAAVHSLLHSCLHYRDQLRPEDRDDFAQALEVGAQRIAHLNDFMGGFVDIIKVMLRSLELL